MMILGEQVNPAVLLIDDTLIGVELDGVTLVYDRLSGWHLGGGVESHMEDRPGRDGTFDGPTYRRARVIVVEGWAVAETRAQLMATVDSLAALLGNGQLGAFTVADPDLGDRTAMVRLSATPEASEWTDTTVRWQLTFTAPDPRKYGPEAVFRTGLRVGGTGLLYPLRYPLDYGEPPSGGSITFSNNGNASVEPIITVSGPLSQGFEIVYAETGQRLRYETSVGSDVVLDCDAGTVSTQGQQRATYLTVREWFSIPAHSVATLSFSSLGPETAASTPTAQMTVVLASAYV